MERPNMSPANEAKRPCLVVGYDGSDAARAAIDYAAHRASPDGLVVPVHAFGPPREWTAHPIYQDVLDQHRGKGQALLDELAREPGAALAEVKVDSELLAGDAAEVLAHVAEVRDADEIVIGSRGFGKLRAALGSVSHELLHVADRPVTVIPQRYVERRQQS